MKVSAHKLASLKILRGVTGKILTNTDHVRRLIKTPGLFKTYTFEPTKYAPQGVHFIELEEVEQWNAAIVNQHKEQKEKIKEAKKYA